MYDCSAGTNFSRGTVRGARRARDEMVHRRGERADFRVFGGELHAAAEPPAHCDPLQLLGELADRFQVTALQPVENKQ